MIRILVSAVFVLVLCGLCLAGTVEVLPDAKTEGPFVKVSEVCRIEGFSDELASEIGGLFLGKAPSAGEARKITAEEVKTAILKKEGSLEGISVVGAPESSVTRDATGVVEAMFESMVAREVSNYARMKSGADKKTEVKASVESVSGTEAGVDAASVKEISVYGHAGDLASGKANFFVKVRIDDDSELKLTVTAVLYVTKLVACASRDLRAGSSISGSDISIRRVSIEPGFTYFETADDAIGGKTFVAVAKGEPITIENSKPAPAVRKRDNITVTYAGDSFSVETSCVALDDGTIGEVIKVQNRTSKKGFYARVTGKGRAAFDSEIEEEVK